MNFARDKAAQNAMRQISLAMETKFSALQKQFQEEIGTAEESQYLEQFTVSSKAVMSQVLNGLQMEKSELQNENGVFRAYVRYAIPVGRGLQALDQRLSREEELYTRFRASEAYEEMEDEIEQYEQWKAEQGN